MLCFYGIELIDLNPNCIIMLSVLTHLCEAYLGVRPSANCFWYFYILKKFLGRVNGCAGLRLHEGKSAEYIDFSTKSS